VSESWTLKVERADHHFADLKRGLAAYTNDDRYDLVAADASPPCKEHGGTCWDYTLRMNWQPDPGLAIIAGDVLFNLRSALDHVAVALVPPKRRGKAQFPIEAEPIWERKNRRFVIRSPEGRRRFRTYTRGMPDEAVALIKRLQPYNGIADGVDQEVLYQLNRLNNGDKHRQLIVVVGGLLNAIFEISVGGHFKREVARDSEGSTGFAPDNARVFHFIPKGAVPQRSAVKVEISGTPVIGIQIVDPNRKPQAVGFMEIEALMKGLLAHIPNVLATLEPYVRRP
jgi:hypothetical protein